MSTPHRTEINRTNAESGKKRSSLNALRHGLTGQIVVMPAEDLAAYQSHVKSFTDEYHPQGATEAHLVQALADTSWRLNRVAAQETNLLSLGLDHPTTIEAPTQIQDAMSIAAALESQSKALSNLSMHSQRLSRQFERTVTQLRDLQQTRRAQEEHDLNDLLDVLEMHEAKGEPYNPSEAGFVFSEQQITESILARNRERAIDQAWKHRQAA
jgi:hypothetical protein